MNAGTVKIKKLSADVKGWKCEIEHIETGAAYEGTSETDPMRAYEQAINRMLAAVLKGRLL